MIKKQGITVTMLVVTIIVLTILAGTIIISTTSTISYSKLSSWANEMIYIQEVVDEQNNTSSNRDYIMQQVELNILPNTPDEQFDGEDISEDNKLILKTLDLGKLKITNTVYGNLNTTTDVYAVSEKTGKIYYVQGIDIDGQMYYSLTDSLRQRFNLVSPEGSLSSIVFVPSVVGYSNKSINVTVKVPKTYTNIEITTSNNEIQIGTQTEKETTYEYMVNTNNVTGNYTVTVSYNNGTKTLTSEYKVNGYDVISPVISEINDANYIYKETENSEIYYINGIKATDDSGIRKIKYEIGEISQDDAKEYFAEDGKLVVDGKINITMTSKNYTIYAEDNAGNFSIKLLEVPEQAYAIYSENTQSLTFVKTYKKLKKGETYEGIEITDVYTGFESVDYAEEADVPWHNHRAVITNVTMIDTIRPVSTYAWFMDFTKCSTFNLEKLDTSATKRTSSMFMNAGSDSSVTKFEIIGTDNWNMSQVQRMTKMFRRAGQYATDWNIGNLSKWDTSKVITTQEMFYQAGENAEEFNIGNIGNWNVSKMQFMNTMFSQAAKNSKKVYIGQLDNWDTSKTTTMAGLFYGFAKKATEVDIGDLSNWNTSKVETFYQMFSGFATNDETFDIGDLSTKEVTRKDGTKYTAWDVSSAQTMYAMFETAGRYSTNWSIGNISNWNTSNVTNMSEMFRSTASNEKITEWDIGDISEWDTSKVTNMSKMFIATAKYADWSLDLSGWNVESVTTYDQFNEGVESKVISPNFKVQETTPTT